MELVTSVNGAASFWWKGKPGVAMDFSQETALDRAIPQ